MDPMLGMIYMVPFNFAPVDYSFCQGQSVTVSQNQALYSLIGNIYGGSVNVNFQLPNLQAKVPVGVSNNLADYQLGKYGGEAQKTLTIGQLPMHTHQATFVPSTATRSINIPAVASTLNVAVDVDVYGAAGESNVPTTTYNMLSGVAAATTKLFTAAKTTNLQKLSNVNTTVTGNAGSPATSVSFNTLTGGSVALDSAGGSQPVSIVQPYLALNFIIALSGIYPSRP
ncbi:tail fiber protein [Rhizobium sp.]|jgi:microcystin-dependent protein|uniref:phage tail protein n=1 Tax=Rhizobium sp. TaxID=391 RepID=UPI002AA71023